MSRLLRALEYAIGDELADVFGDPTVQDMYRNADGSVRVVRAGAGKRVEAFTMPEENAASVLRLAASSCGKVINEEHPFINALLPGTGMRVAGTWQPLTAACTMAIRKASDATFEVGDFLGDDDIDDDWDSPDCMESAIDASVLRRDNIVVSGGTGAGKTTFLKALLARGDVRRDRQVTIENEPELRSPASDLVEMTAIEGVVSAGDLVRLAMRYHPKRLIVGEAIYDDDARAMVVAMNTGHDGSFSTLHANSVDAAVTRLQNMCSDMHPDSILTAVQCFIHMKQTKDGRRIVSEVWWPGQDRRWVSEKKSGR